MHNLFLLLKNAVLESFSNRSAKKTNDSKKKRRTRGAKAAIFVAYAILAIFVAFICNAIAAAMGTREGAQITLNLVMVAASILLFVSSILKVNGTLFGFLDYDLLMSLPIRTGTLIASRLLILYGMSLWYALLMLIPAYIGYVLAVGADAQFTITYMLLVFVIPLLPVVLGALVGTLIAAVSSRSKKKNALNVIITIAFFVVFMIAYMLLIYNMDIIVENFTKISGMLNEIIGTIYPPVTLYASALWGDGRALGIFLLISFGAFLLFTAVFSRFFRSLNTYMNTATAGGNYKLRALKEMSLLSALRKKEFMRLFSSSRYLMNAIAGVVVMAVLCFVWMQPGEGSMLTEFKGGKRISAFVMIFMLSLFVMNGTPAACSLSLEGKNLWILRSLPVRAQSVINAKISVSVLLYLPFIAVYGTLICIFLEPQPITAALAFALPLVYCLFGAFFGMRSNLRNPDFSWTNETTVIKQSAPVRNVTLIALVIAAAPLLASIVFGWSAALITAAVIGVLDVLLYRSLMTDGAAIFNAL